MFTKDWGKVLFIPISLPEKKLEKEKLRNQKYTTFF